MVKDIETREQLNEIMSEDGPTAMIDIWSETCGPCKAMAPHYEAVAVHFEEDSIEFFKINATKQPQLAASFKVRSVPTIMLVDKGEIIDGLVGSRDASQLKKKAEWLLSKSRGEGFFDRLFKKSKD